MRSQTNLALISVVSVAIQPHVPLFAPGHTPTVLQNPVVIEGVLDHPHKQHSMVDGHPKNRVTLVENALVVVDEAPVG